MKSSDLAFWTPSDARRFDRAHGANNRSSCGQLVHGRPQVVASGGVDGLSVRECKIFGTDGDQQRHPGSLTNVLQIVCEITF